MERVPRGKFTDFSDFVSCSESEAWQNFVLAATKFCTGFFVLRWLVIYSYARKERASVSNSQIAELLAREAEQAQGQVRMALKRAARMAFLWPEEARDLAETGRSLTELPGIGPFLAEKLSGWLEPGQGITEKPPAERRGFLTLTEARKILGASGRWTGFYRGDLQMHSEWSDGSGTIAAMSETARTRGYEYIAITDHSKGLKID